MTASAKVLTHTVAEAARAIGEQLGRQFSTATVWGWVKAGKLRGRKIGGKWYVDDDALAEFMGTAEKATA